MNDSTITKLNRIAELCETLREQSEVGSPARAAYQTTIDQCTMLTAALSVSMNDSLVAIIRLQLVLRANVLIEVWAELITQPA